MSTLRKVVVFLFAAALAIPAADPELLKLAMPEARIVSGVSASQIKMSPFGQFFLSRITPENERDLAGFIAATGWDPRTDLNEILIAAPGGPGNQQRLLMARGTFNTVKILDFAKAAGAQVTEYKGVQILSPPPRAASRPGANAHGMPASLALLSSSIAIAGDPDSVRRAIDRGQSTSATALNPQLTAKITQLSGLFDAWIISLVPLSEFSGKIPGNVPAPGPGATLPGDLLKSVQNAEGGVKFGAVVQVSADIVARTAQEASSLADVLRFLAGMAQMSQSPEGAQIRALLSTLSINAQADTVAVAAAIPETQIESLILSSREKRKPLP